LNKLKALLYSIDIGDMDSIVELETQLYGKGKCTTWDQVSKMLHKKEEKEAKKGMSRDYIIFDYL
jgi:hypothetical protein